MHSFYGGEDMSRTLILNAQVVNEGKILRRDVLIEKGVFARIEGDLQSQPADHIVDANGHYLLPGMIDDQVHFREPGLMHKGQIATESAAAVAGGITSYMEMPNVKPATTNRQALEDKYQRAARESYANYAFYLGASPHNLEDIKSLDPTAVCGVKIFMGSSTGDLLVENLNDLEAIFKACPVLIATHCEDNAIIATQLAAAKARYPDGIPIQAHPDIRSREACMASSRLAVSLAKKHEANLHVLHITTKEELALFTAGPIRDKKITAEACVHHLWFCDQDYNRLGNFIKCNPAIKAQSDRDAIMQAVRDDVIDIIATDHAPHTLAEKQQDYEMAPAGLPLVQHALLSLLDHVQAGNLTLPQVVQKIAHNPAIRYEVSGRGFVQEGFAADAVLVDLAAGTTAEPVLYKCGWTPFVGHEFSSKIKSTWVNGDLVYDGVTVQKNKPKAARALRFRCKATVHQA